MKYKYSYYTILMLNAIIPLFIILGLEYSHFLYAHINSNEERKKHAMMMVFVFSMLIFFSILKITIFGKQTMKYFMMAHHMDMDYVFIGLSMLILLLSSMNIYKYYYIFKHGNIDPNFLNNINVSLLTDITILLFLIFS